MRIPFPLHNSTFHRLLLALLLSLCAARGADLQVAPGTGNDKNDGVSAPVKTIARGLKLAGPGDTVHLAPGRYRECAVFAGKLGEPGRPITLDGHGAILDGAEPLQAADWQETAPGLYRNDHLLRMDPAVLARWFLLVEGVMQHMSRTSKGPSAALKQPEELAPGEWTYVADGPLKEAGPDGKMHDVAKLTGAFFVRIDPARKLADCGIEAPLRSAGVQFGGPCAHIVVRNVTATHVYNDGFNIHGFQRDLVFENIASLECGDDGFSAHEDAECRIDGFVSIGNSTGLCDTGTSKTHYRNLYVRGCLGFDVFFTSRGEHSIENGFVESSAAHALTVGSDDPAAGVCTVSLRNLWARRVGGGPQEFRIARGARLTAERCTFQNLSVQATPGSEADLRHCLVTGAPRPELLIWKEVLWRGEGNLYDVASLRVDRTPFTSKTFADFQALLGSEQGSRWDTPAAGFGADEATLHRLRPESGK